MSQQQYTLINLSSNTVYLKKSHQSQNLTGLITISNISNVQIAVKIKSNNPSLYSVTPPQVVLSPSSNFKIQFTKKNSSLINIIDKLDKFQFIAVEVNSSQVQMINNIQKVDDQIFLDKQKRKQKLVLEVQIGSDFNFNMSSANSINGFNEINRNNRLSLNSSSLQQLLQQQSPPQSRTSNQKSHLVMSSAMLNEQKYGNSNMLSLSQSSLKNPMSPQFHKGQATLEKDRMYKMEYDKILQKLHEYEKNYQQLDQEIKMIKSEKETWNYMRNDGKISNNQSQGYESWHVILVILIFMFIGVIWAK